MNMDLKKLDKVFGEFIRRRDADENGMVRCCTCPTVKHWKKMDAGHFVPRKHLSTRWDIENCHPQCEPCNRFHRGRPLVYRGYLKDRYTIFTYLQLQKKSRSIWKPMQHEIDELTELYKQKIKEL